MNRRGSPLKYTSRATYDKNATMTNRVPDLLGLNSIFLIKAIMERESVMINVARE